MTQTKAELLQTRHQGDIRLGDADSSHYVGFKAPATVTSSLVWTLPAADGTAGYYLKTDGSGNLGWSLDNSGVSLSGSTNNTISTVTGANALQGEANLTFDGTNLKVNSSDGGSYHTIRLNTTTNNAIKDVLHVHSSVDSATAAAGYGVRLNFSGEQSNGNEYTFGGIAGLYVDGGANNGQLAFYTNNSGTNTERMRIDSEGLVGIGITSPTSTTKLHIATAQSGSAAGTGMTLSGWNGSAESRVQLMSYGIGDGTLAIRTGTSNTERMRIDSSGRLLLGSTSARLAVGATGDPFLQVEGLAADTAQISIIRNSDSAAGPYFSFVKTRGTSDAANTIVQDGDDIGTILFCPADGVDVNQQSAFIRGEIDGTPGANDTPGRIVFATTADGSGTPTARMRIDSSGNVGIGTAGPTTSLHIKNPTTSGAKDIFRVESHGGGSFLVKCSDTAASNPAWILRTYASEDLQISPGNTVALTLDGSTQNATFASAIYGPVKTVSALQLDLSTGNYFIKTISGNSTFTFANPAASGTVTAFTLELTHSSGTVTWPSSVKWNADTAPTLTTGKTHLFMFVTDDGGTRYRGSALVDYVN